MYFRLFKHISFCCNPWINEITNERLLPFHYLSQNLVFQNACVNVSLYRIGDENCCSSCFGDCLSSAVPCALQSGNYVYSSEGLLDKEFLDEYISMTRDPQQQCLLNCKCCPLERSRNEGIIEPCKGHLKRNIIKECWSKCGCYRQCGNRVGQRGINCKLQVLSPSSQMFFTPDGKGWGPGTLEKLQKGAFVCEFVGEILTITELYERNTKNHNCPVLLDAYWASKGVPKDEEALCLDATCYRNVDHRTYLMAIVEGEGWCELKIVDLINVTGKQREFVALLNPANKPLTQIVQDDLFMEFEFRQYLFACQSKLLFKLIIPLRLHQEFMRPIFLIGYGSDIERNSVNRASLSLLPWLKPSIWPSIPPDASFEVFAKEKVSSLNDRCK
ncbi:hypothetical protein Patl1_37178 [Pistacia atlantica]|nr:hypothetical protein Patl1_37178 [Pistacia atlantica]